MGLAEAKAKYARKTANAGGSWDAAKGRMKQNWGEGLRRFGTPPGPRRTAAYNAGIDAATYKTGDPEKWARNWQAKMAE